MVSKEVIFLIIIHILLFASIFEIYFKSPLVDNIPVTPKAYRFQLAERVVIFYADGVRAEKFYEVTKNNSSYAPFLRKLLANNNACGGIAHTQVPTETRPGAIAMLAGFYEDPSAIFKGWQDNPVEFDHIFNQSEFSVAFGSPDVLKMFSKGFQKTKVDKFHFEFYDENEQQFTNENQLNYWVGNKTLQYLDRNKDSKSLNQDKVIFMLHFLGPDTAGHNYKPHSKEYADNILVVDNIVQEVVVSINEYYNDNRTTFIYASDHGMTDWGSHGDGSDHETETPFVAWGAGVSCPSYPPPSDGRSFLPASGGVLDIAQVDIVSLVATLIGVPIPVHSVGEIPLQYLSLDKGQQALVIRSNALQIHNAYRTLRSQRRESIARALFAPFHKLTEHEEALTLKEIELGFYMKDFDSVVCTFYYRWILSLLILSIASIEKLTKPEHNILSLVLLAVFPMLPIVGTQDSNKYLLIFAAVVWICLLVFDHRTRQSSKYLFTYQLAVLSSTVVHLLLWPAEPSWFHYLISWLILIISPLSICLSSKNPEWRLVSIAFGLAPPFILLCSSYEVFFLIVLCSSLASWYSIECKKVLITRANSLYNAFLTLAYLFLCFFGLGNIASISSYDWSSVRYFLGVFSPFTMLVFCLLKIFIPLLCVSCSIRAIHVKSCSRSDLYDLTRRSEDTLKQVLIFCDMMGLVFLYLVRNTGSWKDIGLSISHVVIVHCIILALMCLFTVASYMVPTYHASFE